MPHGGAGTRIACGAHLTHKPALTDTRALPHGGWLSVMKRAHASHHAIATLLPRTQASAAQGPGLLQRLGRVLKEKAAGDFDRFFKGTTKTRERLGVSDGVCASADRL